MAETKTGLRQVQSLLATFAALSAADLILVKTILGIITTGNGRSYLSNDGFYYLHIENEIPAGIVNGVITTFTLAYLIKSATEQVFLNGVLQKQGVGNDYTIDIPLGSGSRIVFNAAPLIGSKITVAYKGVIAGSGGSGD